MRKISDGCHENASTAMKLLFGTLMKIFLPVDSAKFDAFFIITVFLGVTVFLGDVFRRSMAYRGSNAKQFLD